MKEIKTKPVIKDIKVLDKPADVSRRMKNAYIRTKEQSNQIDNNDGENYVDDAGNSILESTETAALKGSHTVGSVGKKAFRKVRESIKQSTYHSGPKASTKYTLSIEPSKKTATQSSDTFSKSAHTLKQSAKTGRKTVKKTAKGTIKTSKRSVKTAQQTAKATIKTSRAAKTTVRTAVNSIKASRRALQQARAAAKAVAFSVKTAVRALVITIKVTVVAVKGAITLIAVGGWIVIVIILVVCLAGFLLSSGFGIFLSNESYNENTLTMTDVIRELNEEFSTEYEQIQVQYPHDTLVASGNGGSLPVNNWKEILTVYAVKVTDDVDNSMEVATIDHTKKGILRNVFWDMNHIDHWIENIEHEETIITTDKDNNEIEETVTTIETILYINVTFKTCFDMIAEYNFNEHQVEMLNELMQDEYQQLFMQLIGS